jgi:general secretion pathway protein K
LKPPRRQRGIALLTAIVLVALATVLAVSIAFGTAMTARRGASVFTVEQGLQFGGAAEELAAIAIQEASGSTSGPAPEDHPGSSWARTYPPTELAPDVVVEAQLTDESGKFNLNTLVNGGGEPDEDAIEIFERLLEKLDISPSFARLAADWIDTETSGMGEDGVYTLKRPGHRTPNSWITTPSELMSLPNFARDDYNRLLPHVTALPPDAAPPANAINVCFASAQLLDAIEGTFMQQRSDTWSSDPEKLKQGRSAGCFPEIALLASQPSPALTPDRLQALTRRLTTQTTYFRLQTWVSIGTTRFALYSLLRRSSTGPNPGSGPVSVVYRTFGTE